MKTVQLYYDFRSPYTYLAQSQLHDVDVEWLPMDVLDVMKRVNNTPTTVTCAVKRRYAGEDLARWARRYGVPFARHPKANDIDARRLLRATLAVGPGAERETAARALFHGRWGAPVPLDTVADVAAVLANVGLDDPTIADRIDAPETDAALDRATIVAAERGVFGAPTFFLGDEMFFGNDRLDFLREALARVD